MIEFSSRRHGDYGHDCWEGCALWEAIRQSDAEVAALREVFQVVLRRVADEIAKLLIDELLHTLLPLLEQSERLAALDGEDYIRALNGYDDE